MLGRKEIITAMGTLGCAIGIGFFMQQSKAADVHYGKKADDVAAAEMPVLQGSTAQNTLLDVQEITLTSGEFETGIALPEPDSEVITVSTPRSVLPEPELPESVIAPKCDIVASARPIAAAMVDLSLEATCLPNERITVHHNGMIFTETMSAAGTLNLRVPALSEQAVFVLAFANGDGAVAQTTVEELADFDRAVLQWKGKAGFQIHAREFGASYGEAGHIWEGQPGDIAATVSGEHGVLTRHGDTQAAEPLLAEVYTFPKVGHQKSGGVALTVETEVTEANCGLEIEAQSLETEGDNQIRTQNLILSVPDCEAKGSFLVLNNLLTDLKVAAR